MKKILLGALVAGVVAGVVYYLYDPEQFNETVGDLRDKADDIFGDLKSKADDIVGKAKDTWSTQQENISGLAV